MQCSQCNKENRDIAKFCKQCGSAIIIQSEVKSSSASIDLLEDLVGLEDLKKELSVL